MNPTLQPQANFTIVRQIANHLDTDVNYVQAVIRNALTDAIIATVNLTDKGGQRFKIDWQVPADPSGQGFYVSIVTAVYTDSGYTNKNPNYGLEENTYLIQDRLLLARQGGGGSAESGLTTADVRRVFQEELAKQRTTDKEEAASEPLDAENEPPEPKDRTDEILAAIRDNKPVEPKPVDLGPVLAAVTKAMEAIEAKEVTPATDLTPVHTQLQQAHDDHALDLEELKTVVGALELKFVDEVRQAIATAIGETNFISTFSTKAVPPKAEKPAPVKIPNLAL